MEYRHFFVVDDNNNRVGKFDISSERRREQIVNRLPDDLELDPIRIPEHAAGKEQALEQLTENTIEWDSRLERV